jgi:hypothetical protein
VWHTNARSRPDIKNMVQLILLERGKVQLVAEAPGHQAMGKIETLQFGLQIDEVSFTCHSASRVQVTLSFGMG